VFFHGVVAEFVKWVAFYVIFIALLQFVNIEARRLGWSSVSALTGIFA